MAIKIKDSNGKWITLSQDALETSILDLNNNFDSKNVEGALEELAELCRTEQDSEEIRALISLNSGAISGLNERLADAEEDIAYLKENGGGGGGGTALPTITSTFVDAVIEKGKDVEIPIFFSSPNMGSGTAYILINNIEVDTVGVSQGNNVIFVKSQYLTATENLVGIYVKDRAGIVSNQLTWNIVCGGIELTTTFDYEVDYGVTDSIRIPYNIETGILTEKPILHITIDGIEQTYESKIGDNFIDISASTIGLGTHSVTMEATIGIYRSKKIIFNIVVVSTNELFLSTTFASGQQLPYGVPIQIDYRLSKASTESFNVRLSIDGTLVKTQTLTVGSYYWTIQSLDEGFHSLEIMVTNMDYSEVKTITIDLEVVMGEYIPIEDYKLGLLCDLNAMGKNNEDDNVDIWRDESGNGHDGQLVNFNFGTNGFINDWLICDNNAYVVIPWSPWFDNAVNGSTIDIIYEPINSGLEDSRVIDYTQITDNLSSDEIKPFKGVFANPLMATASSASSGLTSSKVNLDDESGAIHLTWVLDRTNKFLKTYINGVLSRIMFLTDSGTGVNKFYEDFSNSEYIYLNSTKGENCGTNNIQRFRVYDHALNSDQVLQNHLANIGDLRRQQEQYNFNYKNTTLPKMYLTGDTTNMTAYQSVPMKIEYVSPNEEKYGSSFNTGIQNNDVLIQGTSSLQYVRHNYTIYLKDEYGNNMLYNPYGNGSVEDYVFCLKADYVESSHANNTGIAKFVNDCLYETRTPSQLENHNCRTTINGFPIEVYINGEYMGIYNFNHDRYSYASYGYDYTKNPDMLVYEINSNSNTSAGAFYRYGDNAESSANVTELDYYKRDFNLIYGNRTADSDSYSEIKELVEWVSISEQDLFRETIGEHFNKEYLFRYYLMVLFIGAVDSLGKNLKINTWDGRIWYPTFYDLDTVLGIDNSGYLTIEPDVEIEAGSYNTSNSNLWSKVWNYFNTELKEEWSKMRRSMFTLDNLMKYVHDEQISKIPPKMYNDDAQVKYLAFGSLYTYCCHGSKEHQIKRWLRERIAYVDSMLGYYTSQDDQVTIRMNKTGYVEFEITPYIPLYLSVKWSNATNGTQTFRVGRGESKKFYYNSTTSTDQEIIIPYASHIKKLDNLTNLNPSSCILSNATKLTNIEIHSAELYNINVTNNRFLRRVDLEGCVALGTVTATGSSLNLSNCKYLEYCNVYNTNLTEVQLNTSGGSLKEIYYPETIQSVQLIKQRLLETVGLPLGMSEVEEETSIKTSEVDLKSFIKNQTLRMGLLDSDILYTFTTEPTLETTGINYGNSLSNFIKVENIVSVDYYKTGHSTNTTQTCNIFPRIALYDKDKKFIIAYGRKILTNSQTKLGLMTSYEIMEKHPNTKYIRISLTNWGEHNKPCYNSWEEFFGDYKICINCLSEKSLESKNLTYGITQDLSVSEEGILYTSTTGSGTYTTGNGVLSYRTDYIEINPNKHLRLYRNISNSLLDSYRFTVKIALYDLNKNFIVALGSLKNVTPTDIGDIILFDLSKYPSAQFAIISVSAYNSASALPYNDVKYFINEYKIINNNIPHLELEEWTIGKVANIKTDKVGEVFTVITEGEPLDTNFGAMSGLVEIDYTKPLKLQRISYLNLIKEFPIYFRVALYDESKKFIVGLGVASDVASSSSKIFSFDIAKHTNAKYASISLSSSNTAYNNVEEFLKSYVVQNGEISVSTTEKPSCICTSLYTVDIQDCPKIKKLNVSEDKDIGESFIAMAYCNNLTLRNSLNLSTLSIDNFYRLAKLTLENMYLLENVNLNNLLLKGSTPTLTYLDFSNCPLLENIGFNCTSDEYEITFSNNAVLNFGNLYNLKTITSNCTWKGVKTLVLPRNFETLDLTSVYGKDSYSDLINIWSSSVCNVNTNGAIPTATHRDISYNGIDFSDMTMKNINMETLVNVKRAINFNIAPTTVNPNFNKNRDGEEYSYFQPIGSIDLSNYEGDFVGFFKGVNIDALEVICNKSFAQTDFSYCFYEATIENESTLISLLCKIANVTNLDYCFYKTSIDDISIVLNNIIIGNNVKMNYTFAECYNLSTLNGITIPNRVSEIEGLFNNCPIVSITNLNINVKGSVKGLFSGCNRLKTVTNLTMPYATDMSNLFENCISLTSVIGFTVPNSCKNLNSTFRNCYSLTQSPITIIPDSVKNISFLFYDCIGLNNINGMTFGSGIENYESFLDNSNVEYLNDLTVNTINFKFTNNEKIKECKNYKPSSETTDFVECFSGCTNLTEFTFHPEVTFDFAVHLESMFEDCINLEYDIPLPTETMNADYMYKNCIGMTHIHSNWDEDYTYNITHIGCYDNCVGVMYVDDVYVLFSETDIGTMYIPKDWGGMGFTNDTLTILKINTSLGDNSLTVSFRTSGNFAQDIQPTVIDWGDGTIVERSANGSDTSHTYAKHGIYTVKFNSSTLQKIGGAQSLNGNIKQKVVEVLKVARKARSNNGLVDVTSLDSAFRDYQNLKYVNLEGIDKDLVYNANYLFDNVSKSTSLEIVIGEAPIKISGAVNMFRGCENIPSIDISGFDFSNCTDLTQFVQNCKSLKSIDFTGHNLSNLIYMNGTFDGCSSLTEIIGFGEIYTPNLAEMKQAFRRCSALTSLDLSGLRPNNPVFSVDGGSQTFGDARLFYGCTSLKTLNMSNYKFYQYFRYQFREATNLQELILDNCDFSTLESFERIFEEMPNVTKISLNNVTFPTNLTDCTCLFRNCSKLTDLTITAKNNVRLKPSDAQYMFSGLKAMTNFDNAFLGIDFSNCTSLYATFQDCSSLKTIDISSLNLRRVSNLDSTFKNCINLASVIGLETQSTPMLTTIKNMFQNCQSLTRIDLSNLGLNNYVTIDTHTQGNWDTNSSFYNCNALRYLDLSNLKIKGRASGLFRGLSNLETLKINNTTWRDINQDGFFGYMMPPNVTTIELNGLVLEDSNIRVDSMFALCTKLTSVDISTIDFSNIKTVYRMFYQCKGLNSINISNHTNLSGIEDFNGMFMGCTNLNTVDIAGTALPNAKTFEGMFNGCTNLITVDITDTALPNAKTFVNMFRECSNLQEIIGLETVSAPKLESINFMFYNCKSLTRIDLSGICPEDYVLISDYNTSDYHHNCSFLNCSNVEYLDLSNFKIKGYIGRIFAPLTNLKTAKFNNVTLGEITDNSIHNFMPTTIETIELNNFNIGDHITSLNSMFRYCSKLTTVDVSSFDLKNVTTMNNMFDTCTNLQQIIGLEKLHAPKLTDMNAMFCNCKSLTRIDLSGIRPEDYVRIVDNNVNWGNSTQSRFYGCSNVEYLDLSNFKIKGYIGNIFPALTNLKTAKFNNVTIGDLDDTSVAPLRSFLPSSVTTVELNNFNLGNVTSLESMFYNCSNLTSIDLKGINGLNNIKSMYSTFQGCTKVTSIDFTGFSMPSLTTLYSCFRGCSKLQQIIGFENFATPNLTDLRFAFHSCSSLTRIDLSNLRPIGEVDFASGLYDRDDYSMYRLTNLEYLDVSNMKLKNIDRMFTHIPNLKTLKLNNSTLVSGSVLDMFSPSLTTLELTNLTFGDAIIDLSCMFRNCRNLTTLDVSSLNTSNCVSFSEMFRYCSKLTTIDISNFDLSNASSLYCMFSDCSSLTSVNLEGITYNRGLLDNLGYMFQKCSSLVEIDVSPIANDATYVTQIFVGCSSLTKVNISNWTDINDTVSSGAHQYIFKDCNTLRELICYGCPSSLRDKFDNWISDVTPSDVRIMYCDDIVAGLRTERFVQFPSNENRINANVTMLKTPLLKIINLLDVVEEGTLNLGSNKARLTEEELLIATSKGWTVI